MITIVHHLCSCFEISRANRLLESVKKLERSEIKVNLIPFEIRTTRIKNVSQVPPYAKTKTMQDSLFTMNSTSGDDVDKLNSDVFTPLSSGFQGKTVHFRYSVIFCIKYAL